VRVRNITNRPRLIPSDGTPIEVDAGEAAEVDDALGRRLLEQEDRWAPAGKTDVDTSIKGVLAQVRNDKGRARTALEAERASENPRSTLVDALTKIIESEED
jgi:hypothetical protein